MRNPLRALRRRLRYGKRSDSLTIFNFHGVTARPLPVPDLSFMSRETFLRQLEAIRRSYRIVSLREGIDGIADGRTEGPSAALTFDDGFANFFEVVHPILKERGIAAACFLVTGLVDTAETIWYCRVHRALSETDRSSFRWRGRLHDLADSGRRAASSIAIQNELKSYGGARLEAAVREIAVALGVDPDSPASQDSPFRVLGSAEVGRLVESGLVEFGAHTRSHAILGLLSPAEQREEIAESVAAVREMTGQAADVFAYPNGRKQDYDAVSIATLRDSGVRAALTTRPGRCGADAPLMELPRFWLHEGTPEADILS